MLYCLSAILIKNELCIPLVRETNVLSTGEGFNCLSPTGKLKIVVLSVLSTKRQFSAIVF